MVPSMPFSTASEVRNAVRPREAFLALTCLPGPDTIVFDEIVIKRTGPGLPTLSFIDLPGIRALEEGDLRRKTQELVDYYINVVEARKQYPIREQGARENYEANEAKREAEAREKGVTFQPLPFDFPSLDTVIRTIQDTIVICCVDGEPVVVGRPPLQPNPCDHDYCALPPGSCSKHAFPRHESGRRIRPQRGQGSADDPRPLQGRPRQAGGVRALHRQSRPNGRGGVEDPRRRLRGLCRDALPRPEGERRRLRGPATREQVAPGGLRCG